ncbi:hypothetical protein, partial [Aeromonas sp. PrichA-15]|uniref:hypothetical protein n=1 Tax=Aeromonas sp. PrichA-15 TaxID=2823360 RepID=UPI001B331F34
MKTRSGVLGLCLLLSGSVLADDIKCYVELINGQKVVLHGTVADNTPKAVQDKFGSSRDLGEVEVDRQGAGKLAVSKHTTTITLLSPCIILILPPSGQVIP